MFSRKRKPDDRSAPRYSSRKPVFMGTFFNFKTDVEVEIKGIKTNMSTIRLTVLVLLIVNALIVTYLMSH